MEEPDTSAIYFNHMECQYTVPIIIQVFFIISLHLRFKMILFWFSHQVPKLQTVCEKHI